MDPRRFQLIGVLADRPADVAAAPEDVQHHEERYRSEHGPEDLDRVAIDPDCEQRGEAAPRGERVADKGSHEAHGRGGDEAPRAPADDELGDPAADHAEQDEQEKTSDSHTNFSSSSSGSSMAFLASRAASP